MITHLASFNVVGVAILHNSYTTDSVMTYYFIIRNEDKSSSVYSIVDCRRTTDRSN